MDEGDVPYCIETHISSPVPDVDDRAIRRAVATALQAEGCSAAEISVAVLGDVGIRQLNQRYLNRDEITDVLAFDLSDEVEGPTRTVHESGERRVARLHGQIVVNVELARREASVRGLEPAAELMLYVVHGCLHLLGYDDQAAEQAEIMHAREDELLVELGYGRTYARHRD